MASSIVRAKWFIMRGFSQQKAEVLTLIFVLGAISILGSLVWEASRPPDGTHVDLSARRQLELIEQAKRDHLENRRLFGDKLPVDHAVIPNDLARQDTAEFNLTKHLRKDRFIGQRPPRILTRNPAPREGKTNASPQEKLVKYYDPSLGKIIMKPAIVEDESDLEGGEGHCVIYDLNKTVDDDFECMTLSIRPLTHVCLYPDERDVHISRHLRAEGIWEPHIVKDFQNLLYGDRDLAVIDIGANIGQYSLLAASMGHDVLAVEPFLDNIRHLQRAARLGDVAHRITLLQNAVSDRRGKFYLKLQPTNQGGPSLQLENPNPDCVQASCRAPEVSAIRMDDLLEVVSFKKAVIKIDIEGFEHRAFLHCERLLDRVYVPYIFMEWMKLRQYFGSDVTQSEDKDLTWRLVRMLTGRGYTAYSSVTVERLNPDWWVGWTDDIIWKHDMREFN